MATTNTELDLSTGRAMCPIVDWAPAKGFKKAEVKRDKTTSGKFVKRIVFDGCHRFKISKSAFAKIEAGELSIKDLQYAEYMKVGGNPADPADWVVLFVPMGGRIESSESIAAETF